MKTELCESRGGRPELLVPNSPYGLCRHKATLNLKTELCESRGGRPGLPVPSIPYGLCGRKATLNSDTSSLAGTTQLSETDVKPVCKEGLDLAPAVLLQTEARQLMLAVSTESVKAAGRLMVAHLLRWHKTVGIPVYSLLV